MTNGWMHVMRATALIPMLFLASTHVAPAQELQWSRYSNSQLGVGVDMPTDLFSVDQGPARNLAGRTFKTSDGRADLSIYTMDNEARETPAAFLRNRFQLPSSSAVYRRVTPRILAVSGFRGDQIWYARCNFSAARVNCVALNYPAREKRAWDAVVTRISNTLSAPSG
jgi:hypothetical protein